MQPTRNHPAMTKMHFLCIIVAEILGSFTNNTYLYGVKPMSAETMTFNAGRPEIYPYYSRERKY